MITRIPVATKLISTIIKTTITTPICNRSKSRTMQQHTKTVDLTTTPTPPTPPTVEHSHSHTTSRTTTTMHCWHISTLQVLLLACLLPLLLPSATFGRSFAAEALPITSKPIEGTAENLAWQAWLMLPPEQRQLEKSRKVTPKSIFSLPFRDCPPGHQLFQSRCIPTVNINQSDLLTQQVLGLFVGAEVAGGAGAGTASGANAYEFDYGDEEYDLGLGEGEGEPVMLYDVPQPFNSDGGGVGVGVGTAAGPSNAQHTPVRDEPLKFNLFEQKFPTNDYETDLSSGSAMEGSGGARPFPELLAPTNGSEGERIDEAGNDNDAGATFFNSSLFLDAVQGFFQRHATAAGGEANNNATLSAIVGTNSTNSTDHNNRIVNGNSTDRQVPDDLHAAGSNVSAFSVDDIDAIILPAVSTGTTVKTISGGGEDEGSADVDLEPQHISLFKDENSIKLLATVIAQQPASDNRIGGDSVAADGDLITASAQQQPHTVAQFLRADALLPLSSVAPYITTTTTTTTTTTATATKTSRVSTSEGRATPKIPTVSEAKDEHPRSVAAAAAAAAASAFSSSTDTDAQETSFITTTEPEGTTSFQIDETTIVEASAGDVNTALPTSRDTLLEAILRQQKLEEQKSKVEKLKDVPAADELVSAVNEETTTTTATTTSGDNVTTKTATNEISETATPTETAAETVKPSNELSEATTTTPTPAPQPLPTSAATAPSLIIATTGTTTTTAKAILANTPSTYRFRSTPTVASAAVSAIHTVASKQVPAIVATTVPQQSTSTTQQAGAEITTTKTTTTRTTSSNDDAVGSGEAVSDVPRSGNNDDLVNVVAASRNSINSNTNNDLNNNKRNENNKNSPTRREPAAAEVNIEQELRMINELVKSNRQLAATKMAAIKTTETETEIELAATATTTTAAAPLDSSTASEINSALEVQKSADTTAAAGELAVASASDVVAVEVRPGIVGATTTMDNVQTVEDTTTLVQTPASASSDISTTTTTAAKMESVNQSSESTITTVENSKFAVAVAETSSTRNELVTKTSVEPDYKTKTETVEGTMDDVEGTGATTLWSRFMPIFGFGGEAAAAATATATQEIAESITVSSIGSSSSSKSSISDSSIFFREHNNKQNNNNNNFEMPSRRNSKIIRIDHLDDNNVVDPAAVAAATGATTTNALEETAATATTTTTAGANLKTTDDLAITPEQDPSEVSTFWWLPVNWRLNRDTRNEEQQPLLFRLWSAFPESQMKAKVRT